MKEYIAYQGELLTIEWYHDEKGESDALTCFKRMGDFGKVSDITKFRNEGDKVFAFKPQPDRFLSFFWTGKKVVVTNGFRKKSKKLPKKEKELALKRMKTYCSKVEEGDYYDK